MNEEWKPRLKNVNQTLSYDKLTQKKSQLTFDFVLDNSIFPVFVLKIDLKDWLETKGLDWNTTAQISNTNALQKPAFDLKRPTLLEVIQWS